VGASRSMCCCPLLSSSASVTYRAAPLRDDETVYDGERVVQAGHGILPEKFRERRAGWRPNLCRPSAAIDLIKVT
jgi:hypothetical protein